MKDMTSDAKVVVISGPTNSGKNTVLRALLEKEANARLLVTATTRAMRPGETNGVGHYFFTNEEFAEALENGDILEERFVPALNTHYGIYRPALEAEFEKGHLLLADLDIVGAKYLKERYGALGIFLLPGSFDELEARMRKRSPELDETEVAARLDIARKEIDEYAPWYDYRVVNADGKLDEAVAEVLAILRKEGYIEGN